MLVVCEERAARFIDERSAELIDESNTEEPEEKGASQGTGLRVL